jgi:O-antigen ligase
LLKMWRQVARALLMTVAFCLPFEAPLFAVGPLVLTTTETVLYLALLAWCACLALSGDRSMRVPQRFEAAVRAVVREPLSRAVLLWLTVTVLSAALASGHRPSAVKFALRTLSACLLYFAARDLLSGPAHARRLVLTLVIGAGLSASLTLVEIARPGWTWWWHLFRPQEFSTTGLRRASGSFAFPNIAAMYWEASIPLTLALVHLGRSAWRAVLAAALLVCGTFATASRAGLGGAAVAAIGLLILGRLPGDPRRALYQVAITVLLVLTALFGGLLVRGERESPLAQRLLWQRGAGESGDAPTSDGSGALPSRSRLWSAALRMWHDHPLLGVGPDVYRHRYPAALAQDGGRRFDDERIHANSLYFETAADMGLLGVVALGYLAYGVWRVARARVARGAAAWEMGLFVAVGTFFVHGTVDYFFEFTATLGLWWLLLGTLGRADQLPASDRRAMTIAPG